MKEFFRVMRHFVTPYKGYLVGSLVFNLLSAILNVFSFVSIIPMLQMLFGIDQNRYEFIPWSAAGMSIKDIAVNNMYWYTTELMDQYGAATALLLIGLFLVTATLLKTGCYFASVAIMVPLRTGIVRDIRTQVYHKIVSLPLSFFSDERKGDIIARMSGDVNEIENSITGSLDMLIKTPFCSLATLGCSSTPRGSSRCSPSSCCRSWAGSWGASGASSSTKASMHRTSGAKQWHSSRRRWAACALSRLLRPSIK